MDDNLKKWLPWIAAAAVALIVVAIIAIRSGDGDDVAATTTAGQATTTEPASTTSLVTTTVPDTTVPPTTVPPTTVAPTTLPPTTLPPTTVPPDTTVPEPPSGGLILEVDGVGAIATFVSFGANDEGAIAAVEASLGPNTRDTGWIPFDSEFGVCPVDGDVRGVEWGSFLMLFTKGTTEFDPPGNPHFFSYYYVGIAQPGFATPDMIEIGSTVAQLKAAYDGPDFTFSEHEFDPSAGFWKYQHDFDTETGLSGATTGLTDPDTVVSINGGIGCGE
jgi:hypothetical protein